MTQKACIETSTNRILELKPAVAGANWVVAPDYIDISWTFDGTEFVPPTLTQEALVDTGTNELITTITSDPMSFWVDASDEVTDEWTYDGNAFVSPPAPVLSEEKVEGKRAIDSAAEIKRREFITIGSGQAMTYANKAAEVRRYIDAGYPASLAEYPYIQAEVNATGQSATDAANNIKTLRDAWVVIDVQIEEERIGGKAGIDAAADVAAVNAQVASSVAIIEAITG